MTNTGRLRAYNRAVRGWLTGKIDAKDLNLLVRARWITKEESERIQKMRVGDQKLLEQFAEVEQ
jgi:hypothetical protein